MTDDPTEPPSPPDAEAELRQQLSTAMQRLVQSELRTHAVRAGIIDLDCLKLLDTSTLQLDADGALVDGAAALASLRRDKPWLFTKPNSSHPAPAPAPAPPKPRMARDMTFSEWQLARNRLIRGR